MSSISSYMAQQYSDSQKLAARARNNAKYIVAEIGWFPWVARQLPLEPSSRVLDIGCSPGRFRAATANGLPEGLDLTLADLSLGMVTEAVERCQPLPFESVHGQQANASALPSALIPNVRQTIQHIEQRQPYSEYRWASSVSREPKASSS